MGHSIGGFMAMEIMKGIEDRNQIVHSVLLMPAIQDLRLSLGAKFFAVFDFFRIFIYIWVCILWMLPEKGITRMLVWMISLFYDDVDEDAVASINELFNLKVASNSLALGRDEFEQVAERDDLLIRQNLSKLSFIFCPKDEWVPYSFVEDLINQYPEADVTTIQGVIHGFNIDRKMTDDVVQVVVSKLLPFTFSRVNKVNNEENNNWMSSLRYIFKKFIARFVKKTFLKLIRNMCHEKIKEYKTKYDWWWTNWSIQAEYLQSSYTMTGIRIKCVYQSRHTRLSSKFFPVTWDRYLTIECYSCINGLQVSKMIWQEIWPSLIPFKLLFKQFWKWGIRCKLLTQKLTRDSVGKTSLKECFLRSFCL